MGTEKNYPPNLDLKMNESVRLKLVYDKCIEGKNSRGQYYLYRVLGENGTERSFSAPEDIHSQIVAHGLHAGSELILQKVPGKNGKGLTGELVFEAVKADKLSDGNAVSSDNFKAIMQQSLQDAIEITKAVNTIPFQNEDIRAISSCLFIARTKSNGHTM